MQLYSSVQLREAAVSSSSITRQGRGSPPLPHISTVLTFYFEYPQAASREPSAATQIPTYVLCSLVQLQEAAVSSSSITRPRRGSPPLPHKYLLTFEVFHTLQLQEASMRLRVSSGRVEGTLLCLTYLLTFYVSKLPYKLAVEGGQSSLR